MLVDGRVPLCPVCGNLLTNPRQRTCSPKCKQKAYRRRKMDEAISDTYTVVDDSSGKALSGEIILNYQLAPRVRLLVLRVESEPVESDDGAIEPAIPKIPAWLLQQVIDNESESNS